MFGFDPRQWERARAQVHEVLVARAREGEHITYSDLVKRISAISLNMNIEKDRTALGRLLGDVSTQTHQERIGMLSVMAILKNENMPAPGFFKLAKELGHCFTDWQKFWVEESRRVIAHYRRSP